MSLDPPFHPKAASRTIACDTLADGTYVSTIEFNPALKLYADSERFETMTFSDREELDHRHTGTQWQHRVGSRAAALRNHVEALAAATETVRAYIQARADADGVPFAAAEAVIRLGR